MCHSFFIQKSVHVISTSVMVLKDNRIVCLWYITAITWKKASHFIISCQIEQKGFLKVKAILLLCVRKKYNKKMSRKVLRSELLSSLMIAVLVATASGTRCYRCNEGGLIKDVRNCGKTIECRYGCKITQVLSKCLQLAVVMWIILIIHCSSYTNIGTSEVVVEQDCFEMTFPYNSNNNNNNNNPTYIPSSQYPSSQYPSSQYPSGQLPPVVFNPHSPSNREYGSGYDNANNNVGLHGCSTLSAIQRFRSLFPYATGYSATCNNCDWDYCNAFNRANGPKMGVSALIVAFIVVYLKNLC